MFPASTEMMNVDTELEESEEKLFAEGFLQKIPLTMIQQAQTLQMMNSFKKGRKSLTENVNNNSSSLELNNFESLQIKLASTEKILEWSHGEVNPAGDHQLQDAETGKRRSVLREDFRTDERLGVSLRKV